MGKAPLNFHYPTPSKQSSFINIIETNSPEQKRKVPTRDEIAQLLNKKNQDYKVISLFDDLKLDNKVLND